jgi:hypothetical protein
MPKANEGKEKMLRMSASTSANAAVAVAAVANATVVVDAVTDATVVAVATVVAPVAADAVAADACPPNRTALLLGLMLPPS